VTPDLTKVTVGEVREWERVARVLEGETVEEPGWTTLTASLEAAVDPELLGRRPYMAVRKLQVVLPDQTIHLGLERLMLADAVVQVAEDAGASLRVTPSPGAVWERQRVSAELPLEAGRVLVGPRIDG
jgi:hypothetical protein